MRVAPDADETAVAHRVKPDAARERPERGGEVVAVALAALEHEQRLGDLPAGLADLVETAFEIEIVIAHILVHRAQHFLAGHGGIRVCVDNIGNERIECIVPARIPAGDVKVQRADHRVAQEIPVVADAVEISVQIEKARLRSVAGEPGDRPALPGKLHGGIVFHARGHIREVRGVGKPRRVQLEQRVDRRGSLGAGEGRFVRHTGKSALHRRGREHLFKQRREVGAGDSNVRVEPSLVECHISRRHKRRCGGVALGVGRDVLQKRLAGRLRIEQRIHGAGGVTAREFIERVEKPVVARGDIRPLAPERRAGDGFIHRVGIYRRGADVHLCAVGVFPGDDGAVLACHKLRRILHAAALGHKLGRFRAVHTVRHGIGLPLRRGGLLRQCCRGGGHVRKRLHGFDPLRAIAAV